MKKRALPFAFLLILSVNTVSLAQDNGIYVGEPKVYDDRSLQILLNAARANLARLQPLDMATLISHIGTIQGADVRQTQFALQANGLPTAQNVLTTAGGTPGTVQVVGSGTTGGSSNTV